MGDTVASQLIRHDLPRLMRIPVKLDSDSGGKLALRLHFELDTRSE